ncbi:MAG TPA: hypothetical protein VME17_12695 [Bryobacteraceae bacterium]|nr:hypothetical protein [Bryobacteraceae bacterium]
MDSSAAKRLTYYEAAVNTGVLAPRGWYCFGTYGSAGEDLTVSPAPINRDGTNGPIVQVDNIDGNTSGRFEVAEVIARVFPGQKAFVQTVIEGY